MTSGHDAEMEMSESTSLLGGPNRGKYGSTQRQQQRRRHQKKQQDWRDTESRATGQFPIREVCLVGLGMTMNIYMLVNLFPYSGTMVKHLLSLDTNEVGYTSRRKAKLSKARKSVRLPSRERDRRKQCSTFHLSFTMTTLDVSHQIPGFYAGYVASSFTFGRFLSGYFWDFVTDRFGRKPVIIMGLLSMITFSMLFGISRSYTMAITTRLVLGLTNGIMPALRTTLSEVCGKKHVVQGMTYTSGATAISLIFGTGIGGLLAQPALHYPEYFSATGLFGRWARCFQHSLTTMHEPSF
ncbi:unnamed protein product [Ectocarpus sp. CCAP 1310/34]|nr:unnamed protein product [Ectocarpus sp. CCAP 1310/34]